VAGLLLHEQFLLRRDLGVFELLEQTHWEVRAWHQPHGPLELEACRHVEPGFLPRLHETPDVELGHDAAQEDVCLDLGRILFIYLDERRMLSLQVLEISLGLGLADHRHRLEPGAGAK
jgi:hypothetical protein